MNAASPTSSNVQPLAFVTGGKRQLGLTSGAGGVSHAFEWITASERWLTPLPLTNGNHS